MIQGDSATKAKSRDSTIHSSWIGLNSTAEDQNKTTSFRESSSPPSIVAMASGNSDGDGAASSASTLSSTFDHAFRLHADIMESAEDWRGERFQAKVGV